MKSFEDATFSQKFALIFEQLIFGSNFSFETRLFGISTKISDKYHDDQSIAILRRLQVILVVLSSFHRILFWSFEQTIFASTFPFETSLFDIFNKMPDKHYDKPCNVILRRLQVILIELGEHIPEYSSWSSDEDANFIFNIKLNPQKHQWEWCLLPLANLIAKMALFQQNIRMSVFVMHNGGFYGEHIHKHSSWKSDGEHIPEHSSWKSDGDANFIFNIKLNPNLLPFWGDYESHGLCSAIFTEFCFHFWANNIWQQLCIWNKIIWYFQQKYQTNEVLIKYIYIVWRGQPWLFGIFNKNTRQMSWQTINCNFEKTTSDTNCVMGMYLWTFKLKEWYYCKNHETDWALLA